MSAVDNPNTQIEDQSETTQTAQNASEPLDHARQDKLSLIAIIDHPKLKKLAEKELTELTTLEAKKV